MTRKSILLMVVSVFLISKTSQAMVNDSRYFPWWTRPVVRTVEKQSQFQTAGFFTTADTSHGNEAKEKKGLYEIWGDYDQKLLGQALVATGKTDPLDPVWKLLEVSIPWDVEGRAQSQGVSFEWTQKLLDNLSLGASLSVMHVSTNQKFVLRNDAKRGLSLTASGEVEIDRQRREASDLIGLQGNHWAASGVGDIDAFVRYGRIHDYILKCRTVDMGLSLGALVPTGKKRDINYASSIPFGGNGFWGMYAALDGMFELREDWTLGFDLRLSQRFKKTVTERLSVKGEPILFGATTGLVNIKPGLNITFNPYFVFGELRKGFGAQIRYTMAYHDSDIWKDMREDQSIAVNMYKPVEYSKWYSEYVTVKAFYDFNKVVVSEKNLPQLSLTWDVPVSILDQLHSFKTHKISLGIEYHF